MPEPPVDDRTPEQKRVDAAQIAQPQQRMAMTMPVTPPPVNYAAPPPTPAAPLNMEQYKQAPPPQLTNTTEDAGIVKRKKSKRKELQQASGGTDALRIKLKSAGSIGGAKKGTGSSGLNIPT